VSEDDVVVFDCVSSGFLWVAWPPRPLAVRYGDDFVFSPRWLLCPCIGDFRDCSCFQQQRAVGCLYDASLKCGRVGSCWVALGLEGVCVVLISRVVLFAILFWIKIGDNVF
jgi:hypothetical protein